jgi:hypothetical protein
LDRQYAENLAPEKGNEPVTVRRPTSMEWVRVRPGKDWREDVCVLSPTFSRQTYLVFGEELRQQLRRRKQGRDATLYTTLERSGVLFLWPIGMDRGHGRNDDWNHTARQAALRAESIWMQLFSNLTLGRYEWEESRNIPDPAWPEITFEAMLEMAFADRIIDTTSHDIIRQLWGE